MADYPCDLHLARYKGVSTRAFLNLYRDDQMAAFRFSVCEPCLADLLEPWLKHSVYRTEQGYWDPVEDGETLESILRPQEGPPAAQNGRRRH